MDRFRLGLISALLLACSALQANERSGSPEALSPAALAAEIDRAVAAKWQDVTPAPPTDDAEFCRRVYLDVAGRIPRVSEIRAFLADTAPDRRQRLVETLLESPQFVAHFSNIWRSILMPPGNQQINQLLFAAGFKSWLEKQFREDAPYDQIVRELLTAPVSGGNPATGVSGAAPATSLSPVGFYQANEFKAENLASSATRLFLGVRLECAQCHDHPFAKWSRDQFWQVAAFFTTVSPPAGRGVPQGKPVPAVLMRPDGKQIKIPGTDKVVQAKFLDGKLPSWNEGKDSRTLLADWITSPENPYFARTAANRLWGHFFGIGLIDPVDDEATEENPASHPELLNELSRQFIAHKFDFKYLVRAITSSQAYQRRSVLTHESQKEPRLFARMAVRGLSPEQLFDSLAAATGFIEGPQQPNARAVLLNPNSPRAEFLNRFARQERATETHTSILQALALMNGKFIADATSLERSTSLAAIVEAPFLSTAQKIETLYLAALSRLPRPQDMERMLAYVQNGGPRQDPRAALADVFWVLLNSSEFILNH